MSTKIIKKSVAGQNYELHLTLNADNKIDGQYTKYYIDAEGNKIVHQTGTYKAGKLHGLTTIYNPVLPKYILLELMYNEGNVHTKYFYNSVWSSDLDDLANIAPNQILEVSQLNAADADAKPKYLYRPLLSAAEFTEDRYNAELTELVNNVQTQGRTYNAIDLNPAGGHILYFTK